MNARAPSRVIVDLDAYAHNLGVVRRYIGDKPGVIAVVKADAYGHGMLPVARKAITQGVRMLGVATVDEGALLREDGVEAPILLMMQPHADALAAALEHRLTVMISDVRTAELLGDLAHRANRVAPVHCKIDTGMGRQGFPIDGAAEEIQFLTRISHVDIEGIATHFPTANKPEDSFTYGQIKAFKQLLRQLDKLGIPYEMAHAANGAAIVNYPGSHFDAVRAGLMTYGIWPTDAVPRERPIKPVLRWESRITQMRHLDPGATVGYGRTYTAQTRMRIAIVPVGYGDGYQHHLSNNADVLIQGRRCPLRGSVSMDQIVVDISHAPGVEVGDAAVLIGRDGDEEITVEEMAERAGTIPYEIVANIGPRAPREYLGAA